MMRFLRAVFAPVMGLLSFLFIVVAWPFLMLFREEPRGERTLGGDEDL